MLWIFVALLLVGTASAWDWDNVKSYERDTKTITVTNALGFGERLAEHQLTENTYHCAFDCYAVGYSKLYVEAQLFSDINFKNKDGKFEDINHKIYYYTNESYEVDVIDYERECRDVLDNKTKEVVRKNCMDTPIGTHKETRGKWVMHNYTYETLQPGYYKWRIEGHKSRLQSVDWLADSTGETLHEWAWWDSDYTRRYNITNNYTTNEAIISVNDTAGVQGEIIWTKQNNESYLYTTTTAYGRPLAIANQTAEKYWEYEANHSGNSPKLVWEYALVTLHLNNVSYFDSTGYGNDGTDGGDTQIETNGSCIFSNCIQLDGNDYLTLSDNAEIDMVNGIFSIEAWVYTNTTGAVQNIINKGEGEAANFYYFQITAGNALSLLVDDGAGQCQYNTLVTIDQGQWYHVVAIKHTGGLRLYINGENQTGLAGQTACGAGSLANSADVQIGRKGDNSQYWKGMFDEIRFYNYTLSTTEINNSYLNGIDSLTMLGSEEVGLVPPYVSALAPNNNTETYSIQANFTYNATDNDGTISSCSLFLQYDYGGAWQTNETDNTITESVNQTFNKTMPFGDTYWRVGCYDSDSQQTNTTTRNYTRLIPYPNVSNVYPNNDTMYDRNNFNFTYNVTIPAGSVSSCSLFLDNSLNDTDSSITTGVNQTINKSLADGTYEWLFECISNEGHKSNSSRFNLSL
jgi:hypothetical protein